MTDKEIIKALECCVSRDGNCEQKHCPIIRECGKDLMAVERHALSLINRQKAEIERLEKECKTTRAYIHGNGLEWDLLSYSKRNGG